MQQQRFHNHVHTVFVFQAKEYSVRDALRKAVLKEESFFFDLNFLFLPFKTMALKNPSLYSASTVIGFSSLPAVDMVVVVVVAGLSSFSKMALFDRPNAGTLAPSGKDCAL